MLEEDQLIELNLFGMITSKAFADTTGQIEIYLPVGAAAYRTLLDIHFTTASTHASTSINDTFSIQPLFKI